MSESAYLGCEADGSSCSSSFGSSVSLTSCSNPPPWLPITSVPSGPSSKTTSCRPSGSKESRLRSAKSPSFSRSLKTRCPFSNCAYKPGSTPSSVALKRTPNGFGLAAASAAIARCTAAAAFALAFFICLCASAESRAAAIPMTVVSAATTPLPIAKIRTDIKSHSHLADDFHFRTASIPPNMAKASVMPATIFDGRSISLLLGSALSIAVACTLLALFAMLRSRFPENSKSNSSNHHGDVTNDF